MEIKPLRGYRYGGDTAPGATAEQEHAQREQRHRRHDPDPEQDDAITDTRDITQHEAKL